MARGGVDSNRLKGVTPTRDLTATPSSWNRARVSGTFPSGSRQSLNPRRRDDSSEAGPDRAIAPHGEALRSSFAELTRVAGLRDLKRPLDRRTRASIHGVLGSSLSPPYPELLHCLIPRTTWAKDSPSRRTRHLNALWNGKTSIFFLRRNTEACERSEVERSTRSPPNSRVRA